jgi:hypothetical protein
MNRKFKIALKNNFNENKCYHNQKKLQNKQKYLKAKIPLLKLILIVLNINISISIRALKFVHLI